MTASDDDTPVTAHRVIDGPPAFAWTHEPARGTDSREPGLRSLTTRRNAGAFRWSPHLGRSALLALRRLTDRGILLLIVPFILLEWAAPAVVWVYVSSHRPAATLVAGVLDSALLIALVLGWSFSLRVSMARHELEAIAQRMLEIGRCSGCRLARSAPLPRMPDADPQDAPFPSPSLPTCDREPAPLAGAGHRPCVALSSPASSGAIPDRGACLDRRTQRFHIPARPRAAAAAGGAADGRRAGGLEGRLVAALATEGPP